MNKCFLTGNLVSDPITGATKETEQAFTKFTVAVERGGKSTTKSCDFVPVEAWDRLAAPCGKYLKKGSKVSLCGALRINTRKNPDGTYTTYVSVRADEVDFCSTPNSQDSKDSLDNLRPEEVLDTDSMPF